MRARLLLVLLAACGARPAPATPTPPVAATAPKPAAPPPVAPAPAPPAPAAQGQYCWISDEVAIGEDGREQGPHARKSGCTAELDQCQKDADEMRGRDGTKIAQECTRQSPVHCYVFEAQEPPLCYASLQDCNEGRDRMKEFGATTPCEPRP
ncbi:MAG: hypothetical protein ACM31C_27695 [Acidobacteriota bacterium]